MPDVSHLTGSRLPEDMKELHDDFMAKAPVSYRGYLLKPLSHAHDPYFFKGTFTYWGWNICDPTGFICMGPAAIWGRTIGDAKSIVDCMCEAGPLPVVTDSSHDSREQIALHDKYRERWNHLFWELMRERSWR